VEILQGWENGLTAPNIVRQENETDVQYEQRMAAQESLGQPITNPNLDIGRQTRVFNLQEMGNEFTGLKTPRELKEKVISLSKQNPIKTSELNVLLNIPESMTKAQHVIFANSSNGRRGETNREITRKTLSNAAEIFAAAPLVEVEKNTDQKNKLGVEAFYHFFFPAIIDGKIETVKVDAESFNDNLDIKDVTLYEIHKTAKEKSPASPQRVLNLLPAGDTISIAEMLAGIKDRAGNYYIDPKTGRPNIALTQGRRGADVTANVVKALIEGNVVDFNSEKKTIKIKHNGYEAILSLDMNGESKTWLLTGWETGAADAISEVSTQSDATQTRPTFSRSSLGATVIGIISYNPETFQKNHQLNKNIDRAELRELEYLVDKVGEQKEAYLQEIKRIFALTEKHYAWVQKEVLDRKIKNELRTTIPKEGIGKYTHEYNNVFEELRRINKLTQEQAEMERLAHDLQEQFADDTEVVGEITPELADILSASGREFVQPGSILLIEEQLKHSWNEHKKQIQKATEKIGLKIEHVEDFVHYVMQNVSAVYSGQYANSFEFVTNTLTPNGVAVIGLAKETENGKYKVLTTLVKDSRRYKSKQPIWESRAYSPAGNSNSQAQPNGSAIHGQINQLNYNTGKPENKGDTSLNFTTISMETLNAEREASNKDFAERAIGQ
jgi:hypothetical protein